MLGGLSLIMLALVGVMAFRQWKELKVRRIELAVQLARREQLRAQFETEITDTSGKLEEVDRWLSEAENEIRELKGELEDLDREMEYLRAKPRIQLVVLDRQTMLSQQFWEVQVSKTDFPETVTARVAPADYTRSWVQGRYFLVGAESAEAAAVRCAARFSTTTGYRVGKVVPYRGALARA